MSTGPIADLVRLPAFAGESAREFVRELARAAATSCTGVLRVTGEPGGTVHLVDGLIVMVESPGAPGVRELLSRPGRTLHGAAELRVVTMMAALDSAFAIGAGWIEGCQRYDQVPEPVAPLPGIDPGWLLLETDRRLRAIDHGGVSPHRSHLILTDTGRALLSGRGIGERQQILLWVNGRRSCRDIAMLLCRSLYAVTVEVSRMLGQDLVRIAPVVREPPRESEPSRGGTVRSLLPRRRRGASGINDALPPRPPQPPPAEIPSVAPLRKSERTQ
ncbi:hypothetical protein [Nocardia sp. NPDC020380]|uniref:hypothetical protein n=1 Tax=Nocardia sp. NPDC020380 TaxID=3364309 RepID=UPI0037BDACAC